MNKRKRSIVEVAVYDYNHKVLPNVKVILKPLKQKSGKIIYLEFDKQWNTYRGFDVPSGYYILQAEREGFESDQREIHVGVSGVKDTFFLGEKGMPFYYRGKVKVPFKPLNDLIGVSVKPNISEKEEKELIAYARELKLKLEEVGEPIRDDDIRIFHFPPDSNDKNKREIQQRLGEHPLTRLVGPIVSLNKKSTSFLTNQLIVGFKAHVTKEEIATVIKQYNLNIIRTIPYAGNTFLLSADTLANYDLLDIYAKLAKNEIVEYAEPNLVITAADQQINPDDFLFPEQWHIPLINLPAAWQLLQDENTPGVMPGDPGDLTFGNEEIIIAIMDRGIQSQTVGGVTTAAHPDFSGTVTSGADKVYKFYDFATMVPNNDLPPNNHGMGCAGVATALVNNPSVVAGIIEGVVGAAPNCQVMGLIRPKGGTDVQYADSFIWTAGFNPGWVIDGINYDPGTVFPAPISPGADIISCSFYSGGALSDLMKNTIDFLTTYGRSGKGVLFFFCAGNENQDFHNDQNWGAYDKAMTVSASTLANDAITEIRADYSDFGNGIDFCAPSNDQKVGPTGFHNPPTNYGIITSDLLGLGNMPGHIQVQTTLSQAIAPAPFTTLTANHFAGEVTLNVVSNIGFAVNQWIRIGQHRYGWAEWVQITAIPAGGNQLTVTALINPKHAGTPIIGATTLNVNSNNGFFANQWLFIGQPGDAGAEAALIREIPAGNTQITIAGPLNNHNVNTQITFGPNNYMNGFGGTSSATPLVAGVAALLLSINPALTWVQTRQILRDTAVKIDLANVDPVGQWVDTDGDGIVDYSQWYGFGRIDAQAAVQAAIDLVGINPLNHIDTWIKEKETDNGDIPAGPLYWSPDVWVRNVAPDLDDPDHVHEHQSPIRGQDNWVYANIRNRGVNDSYNVYVRIYITRWAGTQYIYPDDFIPVIPPGEIPVAPMEPGTYLIGEEYIESIPGNDFVRINMIWPAGLIPPDNVEIDGVVYSWADSCLLVEVSPHDGPTPTGNHTWDNNNLCQKNITIVDPPPGDDDADIGFVVGHDTDETDLFNLRIERKKLPAGVKLFIEYIDKGVVKEVIELLDELKEGAHKLYTCDLTILKKTNAKIYYAKTGETSNVIIPPNTRFTFPCSPRVGKLIDYRLKPIILKDKRTLFAIPTIQNAYVPIPRKKGEYQVIILHIKGLKNLEKGKYQIDIYQENLSGRIDGNINIIIGMDPQPTP
ncbi:MAG: S8 family serine peptidase [Promethearchaeota archaeon]